MPITVKDGAGATQTIDTVDDLMAIVATATNQTALNTIIGAKTDAKNSATDGTSVSAIAVLKQVSASTQAAATSLAGTQTVGLPTGAATSANQTTGNTSLSSIDGKQTTINTAVTAVNTAFGAKTDAKSTATDATSVSAMQVFKQISSYLGNVLRATISDGTNDVTIKPANVAATNADKALTVALRPSDMGADPFAEYETVAASQTNQVMGASGAIGDYLAGVVIFPTTTSPGAVTIKDGSNSAITIFAGGASSISNLRPIQIGLGIYSVVGAWQITTGANETAIGIGSFT